MNKLISISLLLPIRKVLREVPLFANWYRRFFTDLPIGIDKPEALILHTQDMLLDDICSNDAKATIVLVLGGCNAKEVPCDWKNTIDSLFKQTYSNW
jgi:hypothetical protein